MRLQVVISSCELGLFDAVAGGAADPAAIAKKIKASLRGTTMLLEELAALQLLKRSGDKYTLLAEAKVYLLSDSPTYLGPMLKQAFFIAKSWENLTDVVRTGKPVMRAEQTAESAEFFKDLVRGLYAASYASANLLLPHLKLDRKQPVHVLDVAAGSAAWSLPIAESIPGAQVTVLDLPPVCDVAREFAERHSVGDRYDYLEGDLRSLKFAPEKYDVIILGHICHSEGARNSQKLIAKCARALKRGGQLVIPDMIPDDKRSGPEFPLLFAINMLLHTTEGSTFSVGEYKKWLTAEGLKFDRMLDAGEIGTETIIARKP